MPFCGYTGNMSTDKARAVQVANAQAKVDEYAASWSARPNKLAARHFGVTLRTIGRWRERLGLPDKRRMPQDKQEGTGPVQ